jgi:glycosyltransferase involved in cell wall biosynthesis
MLSKVPSVITLSGIVHEYAKHKENAWVVDYQNSEQIAEGILALLDDKSLREKIASNAFACASNYSIQNKMRKLEELYVQEFKKNTNKA